MILIACVVTARLRSGKKGIAEGPQKFDRGVRARDGRGQETLSLRQNWHTGVILT